MKSMHCQAPRGRRLRASGFTLVEMMVAMVIGLFLSLALTGIYIALKRNFLGEDSIVSTLENQRLALSSLTNSVQSAGYFSDPLNENRVTIFPADGVFSNAGQVIFGQVDKGIPSLSVRYQTQPNDGIMNCAGSENDTGASAIFTNTFTVNAKQELICTYSINSGAENTLVLSKNISKIAFLYAADSDADGIVDSYLNETQAAALGWSGINGVRIDLTLKDTINYTESQNQAAPKSITHYVNLMNTYEVPK